jgi:hypothetical protein
VPLIGETVTGKRLVPWLQRIRRQKNALLSSKDLSPACKALEPIKVQVPYLSNGGGGMVGVQILPVCNLPLENTY